MKTHRSAEKTKAGQGSVSHYRTRCIWQFFHWTCSSEPLLQLSKPSQCPLRNDGTITTRVLYIQLYMTSFTSVPYEITYKFKHVAQRRTTAASRDTNQRNPSIFTWINATLKKHQQNCAERILQSIPFCLHCRDLSGKNAINEHGSASFYLRNPWIKWFTFIHSLVKWGVGTNPL